MKPSKIAILSALASWGALAFVMPARSEAVQWSGWLVYWDGSPSLQEVQRMPQVWDEISNFAYRFDHNGSIIPVGTVVDAERRLMAMPQRKGKVLTALVNDAAVFKDPTVTHRVLTTPSLRTAAIKRLVQLAATTDGIDIDFENMNAASRTPFTEFIRDLAAALHAKGKWLSVTVESKTSDVVSNGAGAIDWAAVTRYADELKIMAYYYSWAGGSPGPLCPPSWLKRMIDFAVQNGVPKNKLCFILPTDGIDWPSGRAGAAVTGRKAFDLATQVGAPWKRDGEGNPNFTYRDSQGVQHQVWTEDNASLQAKAALLQKEGVTRVGLWRINQGDPKFWDWLATALAAPAPGVNPNINSDTGPNAAGAFAPDLNGVRVFPNPWRINEHGAAPVRFDRLTADAEIKIYTLAGEHVKTLPPSTDSMAWDLTDRVGDHVASGLYFYSITNPAGQHTRGKLAIIR